MELSSYIIWNVVLTLVVAPVLYVIRNNATELKQQISPSSVTKTLT